MVDQAGPKRRLLNGIFGERNVESGDFTIGNVVIGQKMLKFGLEVKNAALMVELAKRFFNE